MQAQKPKMERTNERMEAFSDAIFAFAMTLLVIEIKVPDVPDGVMGDELGLWIVQQLPKFSICILTFVVVGYYWLMHHRMFQIIRFHDNVILWLNLAFLLCISLIPFPTAIISEYAHETVAVVLYASFMAIANTLLLCIWLHAAEKRRFMLASYPYASIKRTTVLGFAALAVFLLSIPLAFVSTNLAMLSWVLIFFTQPILYTKEGAPRFFG